MNKALQAQNGVAPHVHEAYSIWKRGLHSGKVFDILELDLLAGDMTPLKATGQHTTIALSKRVDDAFAVSLRHAVGEVEMPR